MLAALVIAVMACKGKADHSEPFAEVAKACRDGGAELSCSHPIFGVSSLKASQSYYRDALGFKLDWDYGDPPDFGSVSRGNSVLFIGQDNSGSHGSWMMVFARDVDALYAEFVERKAIIKMPPTNMPWGLREMHVADPDGNVIRFGSSIDH